MTAEALRRKVSGFVLHPGRDGHPQLLVYWLAIHPQARWRVPGGILYEGETPEKAILRELGEAAGIDHLPGLALIRPMGVQHYYLSYMQAVVERHDFLFRVSANAQDSWTHIVRGKSEDAGAKFAFRWIGRDDLARVDPELGDWIRPDYLPEFFDFERSKKGKY
jgi:ADP-ribose pyrophosphatase YjhB (NUDIX family)